ncbi:MAG: hypothetical protein K2W94_08380 [Alphaproteobacteria bacterium]|nr:hypothetical protein [Alphaproteobacteria bacterium]
MTANVGKIVLALGLFSFFLSEKVQADAWDNGHEDRVVAHSHPAYVRASYSPEDQESENKMQDSKVSSSPTYYVTNDAGKARVLRTKAPHRSGRLFVKPLRSNDASINVDKNGDSLFQGDDLQIENNFERSEDDALSLETIGYTAELLRQKEPDSLISYVQ